MKNKSLYLILFSLLLLSACGKPDVDTPADLSPKIRLNISVAAPVGADSKAVKNAWAEGDKINIWFDADGAQQTVPDLVMSNDGTSWNSGVFRDGVSLNSSGSLLAVYESHNDLSTAKYSYNWESAKEWFLPQPSLASSDYRCMPMVVYSENVPYSFTMGTISFVNGTIVVSDSVLTIDIVDWVFQTRFKVLVKNDDEDLTLSPDNYVLQVHNLTTDSYPAVYSAWQVVPGATCPSFGVCDGNAVGKAAGVQEADGIAFYYDSFSATGADIFFTLWVHGDAEYVYGVKGKSLDATGNKCSGVALKHSSFSPKGNIDTVPIDDWGTLNAPDGNIDPVLIDDWGIIN